MVKLKSLAGNKRPFWAVDCETDPFDGITIPAPFIWGVFDGWQNRYWEFTDTEEMIKFLARHDVIVYAHNGGKFDWHFVTPWLEDGQEILFIAGRMARFRIGKCEFRDSFNLLPVPLSAYQKDEIDYDKMHREVRAEFMDEIKTYLKSDCVNLWNFVHGFESEYGRHLTQATAAMRIWNRQFKGPPQRSGVMFFEAFKPYYYGGRVQCFRQGDFKQRAIGADINSAYPFAMTHPHPIGRHVRHARGGKVKAEDGRTTVPRSKWGPLFFDVECVARGCFPYRDIRKAMYYPADNVRRVYHVTGWELLAALRTKTIEPGWKILGYKVFRDTIDFKDYVRFFWDKRKEFRAADDWGGQYYCKIFMNALYGKFAADPRRYHKHILVSPDNLDSVIEKIDAPDFYRFREWFILREKIGDRDDYEHRGQRFYNLATAASITGFVRAMLWEAVCKSKGAFYCDTDSITATGFGNAITLGPELGQWEIEGRYDRVVVAGKKLYAFHFSEDERNGKDAGKWKVRSKGVRLDNEALIKIAMGNEVIFNPEVPTFSAHSTAPEFIPRRVRATAKDISIVPPELDPQNVTPVTGEGIDA